MRRAYELQHDLSWGGPGRMLSLEAPLASPPLAQALLGLVVVSAARCGAARFPDGRRGSRTVNAHSNGFPAHAGNPSPCSETVRAVLPL